MNTNFSTNNNLDLINTKFNNNILTSVDDTLIPIGPVKITIEETYKKSGFWLASFKFKYGGKTIHTVTGKTITSETIPIGKVDDLLEDFMNSNDFYVH
ncbi:MAG: hypothetical protein ACP5NV_04470, partial [Candidatus Woesearchaeota archaeon]